MQVRLLGPLEVAVDGASGAPPGTGERSLLALLALRGGRVVPVDHLVDALWGEELPANPQNALQLRVSKLRRWLAGLGIDPAVLATRAPGYLLDVSPAAVDALAVVDEVAAARATAAGGATAMAAERYRAALARWVGPPLCDVPATDWAAAEATRLDELRLAALEEVLELDLAAGRHRHVVEELDQLVAAHPLRERFHAQRMLALYRSGRQADALAAYQHLRTVLAEELGLDPSAEARELEVAILQQDPALDLEAAAPAASELPTLPERVASFRGREHDVDELERLLGQERLVTCTGPGGTGKTTLAVEAARRLANHFPAGAWFVPLAGVGAAEDLAAQVSTALGLPATELAAGESPDDRLARQLGARHALVVLDNCEHLVDPSAVLVERLLERCPNVRVLATSREPLQVLGEVRYAVPPLATPSATAAEDQLRGSPSVQLFLDRALALDRTFAADGSTLGFVADICRRLDGLPLAIELAAARTTTLSVEEIAARLGDHLALLTGGGRTAAARHQTLRATVAWSHDLLSPEEQVLFRRLSLLRSPWDLATAEAVVGGPGIADDSVLDLVGSLVDRSLVVRAEGRRFKMLETIRQYGEQELVAAGEEEVVRLRLLDHLTALAAEADPALRTGEQVRWLERLRAVNEDLRQALAFCEDDLAHHGADGLRLAGALGWFWYLGDHEEGARHLHRLLTTPDVPDDVRGPALLAVAMVERPSACIVHPSEVGARAASEAREVLRRSGDTGGAALAQVLAAVEGVRGTGIDEALAALEQATRELAADDEWTRALVDFVRMEILMRRGSGDEAMAHGERAVTTFARLGDLWGLSAVRSHMGANLRLLGRVDAALDAYEAAMAVAQDVGLHNTLQMVGAEIGILRAAVGDAEGAHRQLTRARVHARRYGYRNGIAAGHLGHGHLARWAGDPEGAGREYEHAARELRDGASLFFVAEAYSGLGFCAEVTGDRAAAAAAHDEVADIARRIQEPRLVALALEGFAGIHLLDGDPSGAAVRLGQAEELRRRHDRPANGLERADIERLRGAVDEVLPAGPRDRAMERGRQAVRGAAPAALLEPLTVIEPAADPTTPAAR
jgi:predicted ATPase/DNA-binding SARP family transcriptional activator